MRDYEGRRELYPQCEPEYTPEWKVVCDSCGMKYKVDGGRPTECAFCTESDLDALTITEVTP